MFLFIADNPIISRQITNSQLVNLLVFDIDGTLLNSTGVDDECYEKALKETYNISFNDFNWEDFKDVTDQGVTEDILTNHFGRQAVAEEILNVEHAMGNLVAEQRLKNPEKFKPAEGVESLLEELSNQNDLAFCLATGAWKKSAEQKLSVLDLDLDKIPWQHCSHIRRRADIVMASLEKAKLFYKVTSFDNICALGDGKWDFLTAQELEINFIGIDLNNTGRLLELGADKIITKYNNLHSLTQLAF